MKRTLLIALIFCCTPIITVAQTPATGSLPKNQQPSNPCPKKYPNIDASCQEICQACFQQQYVVGDMSIGKGFWADCVIPLVTGKAPSKPAPPGITLPALQSVGATCNSKSPLFWKQH